MSSQWPPTEPPNERGRASPGQHGFGPPGHGPGPTRYPQQQLSPQEIQPSRSRKPLFIGIAVAVALIVGGLVTWALLDDAGEDTRAQYCAVLKQLTAGGDLTAAVSSAEEGALDQVTLAYELAPDAVQGHWETLEAVSTSLQSDSFDTSLVVKAYGALRAIARDAESNCDLTIEGPGLN